MANKSKSAPQPETGVLNMYLNDSTDDVVALQDKPVTPAVVGTILQIGVEYMTVTDASNQNNLKVTRGTAGPIEAHPKGVQVFIGASLPPTEQPGVPDQGLPPEQPGAPDQTLPEPEPEPGAPDPTLPPVSPGAPAQLPAHKPPTPPPADLKAVLRAVATQQATGGSAAAPAGLPVSNLINVQVTISQLGAQAQNLHTLLILGSSTVIDTASRARSYSSIEEVVNDFGSSAPEYLASVLWFEQNPQPNSLMIGRWAKTAAGGALYGATLTAQQQLLSNFTAITAGGFSATVDGTLEHYTGMNFSGAANLNAVASIIQTAATANLTCIWNAGTGRFVFSSKTTGVTSAVSFLTPPTAGSDISTLVGGVAGEGGYVSNGVAPESALQAVVACDLQFGQQWYAVTVLGSADSDSLVIASYIEAANTYHFFGVTTQSALLLTPTDTTNVAYQLMQQGYNNTAVQYSSTNPYAVCSLLARILTTNWQGNNTTITLMYKQEPGITPENLSSAQAASIAGFNCNVFAAYNNNTAIIQYGTVASGEYIDTIIGADSFAVDEQTAIYNLLYTSTTKIPQTDGGMNQIGTTIEAVAAQYVNNGFLGPGFWTGPLFGALQLGSDGSLPFLPKGYYLYTPPIVTQSQSDRAKRISVPFQLGGKLQGAVHAVNLLMTINP